jgi:hypothetical protein
MPKVVPLTADRRDAGLLPQLVQGLTRALARALDVREGVGGAARPGAAEVRQAVQCLLLSRERRRMAPAGQEKSL